MATSVDPCLQFSVMCNIAYVPHPWLYWLSVVPMPASRGARKAARSARRMAWWDDRPVCAGAEARPWRALRSAEASRRCGVLRCAAPPPADRVARAPQRLRAKSVRPPRRVPAARRVGAGRVRRARGGGCGGSGRRGGLVSRAPRVLSHARHRGRRAAGAGAAGAAAGGAGAAAPPDRGPVRRCAGGAHPLQRSRARAGRALTGRRT